MGNLSWRRYSLSPEKMGTFVHDIHWKLFSFNPFKTNGIFESLIQLSQDGTFYDIEGLQVIIFIKRFISFSEDRFRLGIQCRHQ